MPSPRLHAGNPFQWAADKRTLMRTWFPPAGRGRYPTVAATLERFTPIVLPGVPWHALAGFAANGEYPWANTTEAVKAQGFHEMGLLGTPGGLRGGPAPNPKRTAPYNAYGRHHDHGDVLACLGGRPATMVHNAWKTAIADQLAVGLVNLREDGRELVAKIDARIRPASESSTWFAALAFAAWSAGPAGAANHLRALVDVLAAAPEERRFAAWIRIVCAGPARPKGHGNPAYTVIRTWQKLEAGHALALASSAPLGWFDWGLGADAANLGAEIARKAYKPKLPPKPPAPA